MSTRVLINLLNDFGKMMKCAACLAFSIILEHE